jgi:hypothetical protein
MKEYGSQFIARFWESCTVAMLLISDDLVKDLLGCSFFGQLFETKLQE